MIKSKIGPVTAYADAVAAGYKGTREEFAKLIASFADTAKQVSDNAEEVLQNKKDVLKLQLKAKESEEQTGRDRTEVETMKQSVELSQMQVDDNLRQTEELKNQAQTSAENAELSEHNAKESENAAIESRTGAETAEDSARQYAAEALEHKNIVEQNVSEFDAKVAAAVEAIQNKGNETIESIPEDYTALQKDVGELKGDLEKIKQSGSGLSKEAIDKLEEIGNHLAYTTADGGSKWTELIAILRGSNSGSEVTLSSISATYTGGNVVVGTSLSDLSGITVTATYSDGSTENVTGYTLSGTIAEGQNIITISYDGKTTTITVVGVSTSGGETGEPENPTTESWEKYEIVFTQGKYISNGGNDVITGITDDELSEYTAEAIDLSGIEKICINFTGTAIYRCPNLWFYENTPFYKGVKKTKDNGENIVNDLFTNGYVLDVSAYKYLAISNRIEWNTGAFSWEMYILRSK